MTTIKISQLPDYSAPLDGTEPLPIVQSGSTAKVPTGTLRAFVNVKDYGATGDGVTLDTAAVEAALAASTNVYFPAGTYLVSDVAVPAGRTCWALGDAVLKLKQLAVGDYSPIFNVAGDGASFNGLVLDGNRDNQPQEGWADAWGGLTGKGKANRVAIYGDVISPTVGLSGIRVTNCEFYEFYGASIATRDASDVYVSGCNFHDNNFEACLLYTQGTGVAHSNAIVTDCTMRTIASGDAVVNADVIVASSYIGVVIADCYCDDYERLFVKFEKCSDVTVTGNSVSNSTLYGGIGAQAGGDNYTITGNVLRDIIGSGIGFSNNLATPGWTAFNNVTISNNVIDTVSAGAGLGDGISFNAVKGIVVSGNVLRAIHRVGIYVDKDCDSTTITGNMVALTNAAVYGTGISVDTTGATLASVSITGNTFDLQARSANAINLFGSGAINQLAINDNVFINVLAASNAIRSSDGAVLIGSINHNVAPTTTIEVYAPAGSALSAFGNVALRVVAPEGPYARQLPAAAAAPVSGAYYVNDVVLNSSVTSGGYLGWICTGAGSPGTWKGFGAIA